MNPLATLRRLLRRGGREGDLRSEALLQYLWAPWRIEYIGKPKGDECILCTIPRESADNDRKNLLLHRGSKCFIILNRFPYNSGHLMIAPYRHALNVTDLNDDELHEVAHLIKVSINVLNEAMRPDGFNIGVNIGKAAGAGMDHFHVHVVPRWVGDTNFMPILSSTKVVIEYLESTYDRLKPILRKFI